MILLELTSIQHTPSDNPAAMRYVTLMRAVELIRQVRIDMHDRRCPRTAISGRPRRRALARLSAACNLHVADVQSAALRGLICVD
jgi:hypothetical protein